jgi:hypothetical protein
LEQKKRNGKGNKGVGKEGKSEENMRTEKKMYMLEQEERVNYELRE